MNEVRIDKWMWATRIFKTRTIAAEACKKNRVMINGVNVKPSRMIKVGEVIQVRKPPIDLFPSRVLDFKQNAVWEPNWCLIIWKNVTTPDQYEILEMKPHIRIRRPCTRLRPSDQERPSRTGAVYRSGDDERRI